MYRIAWRVTINICNGGTDFTDFIYLLSRWNFCLEIWKICDLKALKSLEMRRFRTEMREMCAFHYISPGMCEMCTSQLKYVKERPLSYSNSLVESLTHIRDLKKSVIVKLFKLTVSKVYKITYFPHPLFCTKGKQP